MKEKELTGKQIEEVSDTSEKGEKMENKSLNTQNLEAVSGGKNYSCEWNIGEEVSISSAKPKCPDCGGQLSSAGYYSGRGFDAFKCRCGQYYVRMYVGDVWHRAYPIY